MDETTEEAVGGETEIDELLAEINGDAVEANHGEEQSPAAPPSHINEVVEEGEQQQGVGRHDEDEAAGPQLLVDGEVEAPQQPESEAGDSCDGHPDGFFAWREARPLQLHPLAGEHSEEGRTDCRYEAENALGVEVAVVDSARQEDAVDISDDGALGGVNAFAHCIRGWDETHQQPVAHEECSGDACATAPTRVDEE